MSEMPEEIEPKFQVLNLLRLAQRLNVQCKNAIKAFRQAYESVKPSNTAYAAALALYQDNSRDFSLAIEAGKSL